MNRIDFDQTGGYRLETQTFSEMQKNYNLLQALGNVLGNRAIVKGCVVNGSTVSDGVIYWDGELIEFKGGNLQTKIVIVQTSESILFLDGNQKPTFYRRHATFGTGVNAVDWSDFKRIFPLSSALFLNEVRMYAGAMDKIPAGWQLCDGVDGRPNLKGRFIVGYDSDDVDYNTIGKSGGAKNVTLTVAQLPKFRPSGTAAGPYEGPNLSSGGGFDGSNSNKFRERPFTANEIGGDQPHENRPPYYTLAYIIYTGN